MSEFKFPTSNNPKVRPAYSEIESKAIILKIIPKKDKNGNDFWIIETQNAWTAKSYLCFSTDYQTTPKTKSLLINFREQLINKFAYMKIRKQGEKEKVVEIEPENEIDK